MKPFTLTILKQFLDLKRQSSQAQFKTQRPLSVSRALKPTKESSAPLKALTAAALCLPGLSPTIGYAYEEEASFSYGHYQEGKRDLFGAQSNFNPIEVESLQGTGKFKLTDRVKFAFNFVQDTWSGATPITTMPLAFGGNGLYTGTGPVVSGATPYLSNGTVLFDSQLNPLRAVVDATGTPLLDGNSNPLYESSDQLVHTLAMASPETRKQGDFKLGYEWDEAALDIGGGVSIEDDYQSSFGNINSRWDFNQKNTSLNLGLSFTKSETNAIMNHDTQGYYYPGGPESSPNNYNAIHNNSQLNSINGKNVLTGDRNDWSTHFGITQILNKNALIEASVGYSRSTGFQSNPYKFVSFFFIDPTQTPGANGELVGTLKPLFEERPNERNQVNGNLRFVQHFDRLDSSLHFDYRIFSDDWGITSHTFQSDWVQPIGQSGWTITPRIRYYSQSASDFYTPYQVTQQAFQTTTDVLDTNGNQILQGGNIDYFLDPISQQYFDANGDPAPQEVVDASNFKQNTTYYDRSKMPHHYSSDHRLSGYGALSGGLIVSKQFAKGLTLDLGAEYYTHQGGLKIGGGGEGNYADFDYWTANATLKLNLDSFSLRGGDHQHKHLTHHATSAPAGVMFDHMLPEAGSFMVGYRYMYGSQGANMLGGSQSVTDQTLVDNACLGSAGCFITPQNMAMHMHMLDLMYAPTDWLTLMLMPQFVDMSMSMRGLAGAPDAEATLGHNLSGHVTHHIQNGHETGGIGDLGMYGLVKLFDDGRHHLHFTAGVSAPTGDVNLQLNRNHQADGGYIDYGMQLGSGTWDFKPSMTYTGHIEQWSWGAQVNGTVRMENQNRSGYALGDSFQATSWGGYNLTSWLTASIRGIYTQQGAIKSSFNGLINQFGPMDYPLNYCGKYWDVGLGLSAVVPSGELAGNRFSVEWLQPVKDQVNGYQNERDGALSATWSMAF